MVTAPFRELRPALDELEVHVLRLEPELLGRAARQLELLLVGEAPKLDREALEASDRDPLLVGQGLDVLELHACLGRIGWVVTRRSPSAPPPASSVWPFSASSG